MNTPAERLFWSTVKVLVFSILAGVSAGLIFSSWATGVGVGVLVFVIQYILFSFIAEVITNTGIVRLREKMIKALEPLSTILECAYCQAPNVATFVPTDHKLEFVCEGCKKRNAVSIQIVVAQVTEPIPGGLEPVEEKVVNLS